MLTDVIQKLVVCLPIVTDYCRSIDKQDPQRERLFVCQRKDVSMYVYVKFKSTKD